MNDRRKNRRDEENRHRTINYIVIALLAALIVTVLFLVFGRSDKDSSNSQTVTGTTTEQVNTPSGTESSASTNTISNDEYNKVGRTDNSNTVNRPPATVTRPSSGNTINRPSSGNTNTNTVNRPPATVTRPSTGNTVNRPSNSSSSSSGNGTYSGRTDYPHTTKMDVLNGTYKEGDENKNNSSSTSGRRGGTRRR